MVALMLVQTEWQKAGFDPELGLDKHFYDQAKAEGKTTQGLETADYQISRLDDMTMEQQEHLLSESLKDLDAEKANMARLVESWRAGDAPGVERIVLSELEQEPLLYQRLLVGRNRNWVPKTRGPFRRPRPPLAVAPPANLWGPHGLSPVLQAQ